MAATTGLLDAITAAGGDADQILQKVALKRSALANSDGFIAAPTSSRVLEEAARAAADECFGLHFGEQFDPKDIGALVYVVVHSATIGVAIDNIERYLHIHNNAARVSFSIEGEHGYFRYLLADGPIASGRQHNEYSMAVVFKTFRIMTGSDWLPQEVRFVHDSPVQTSEHLRLFGCPVRFGCASNALVVERGFGERCVRSADPKLYRVLKQHVERIIRDMPRENDLVGAVRRAIGQSVADGDTALARVAGTLAMSTRTLERRLKENGVIYRDLVTDTRRRFALEYLKDRNRSLSEVAFLLGYSEVSAFNRAFKRSTGSTPLQYRESATRGSSSASPAQS
ncbi:MAG: AraC family transcriptional regulator [Burkholderiales bacterium]